MRSSTLFAVPLLLAASSSAFRDTAPLYIWSSTSNDQLADASSELSSGVINAQDVYSTLSSVGCDWERMVVLNVAALHQSHVPSLSLPPNPSLHIPYLVRPDPSLFAEAIRDWSLICGADLVSSSRPSEGSEKTISTVEVTRSDDLTSVLEALPYTPDLIVLHGTAQPSKDSKQKRQGERPFPTHASSATTTFTATASSRPSSSDSPSRNSTIPPSNAPLLERSQFFTTPIITGLLVVFLILLPLLGMGISALAGIQVPRRMMEISKSMQVGKDKKDQ